MAPVSLKFKVSSHLLPLKWKLLPFSHQPSPQPMDYVSEIKSKLLALSGITKALLLSMVISHAVQDLINWWLIQERLPPSTTNSLMLIAMDNKTDWDWVHAQDLKDKERTSFQRLAKHASSKQPETTTVASTCTLHHVIDQFTAFIYLLIFHFLFISK